MADSVFDRAMAAAENLMTSVEAQASTSDPGQIKYYAGKTYQYSGAQLVEQKKYLTGDDIANRVYGLAGQENAGNANSDYMKYAGNLVSIGALYSDREKGYVASVVEGTGRALAMYQNSGSDLPFDEWLDRTAQKVGRSGDSSSGYGGGGGGGYTGPVTTTSRTITDEVTAENLLQTLATDMLGRSLTTDEVAKYTKQFNQQERANPQVTVSQASTGSQSSTTNTAPDKAELLRRILVGNEDFMENQIDTTVMDMFVNRVKGGQAVIDG